MMKSFRCIVLSLVFFTLCLTTSVAQTPVLNKFYHQHKDQKGAINFTLPKWLFKLGSGIAKKYVEDDPEAKAALNLMKKVKNGRFLVMENPQNPIPMESFDQMVKKLKKRNHFEDLMMVKTGETRVNFMIKEGKRGSVIKNLLILVNEEDTFVMASLKTKLKYEEVTDFINQIMEATQEDEPERPVEPKVKPQA